MVNCKILRHAGGFILRHGSGVILRHDDTCVEFVVSFVVNAIQLNKSIITIETLKTVEALEVNKTLDTIELGNV